MGVARRAIGGAVLAVGVLGVSIPFFCFWISRYEMKLWSRADCGALQGLAARIIGFWAGIEESVLRLL